MAAIASATTSSPFVLELTEVDGQQIALVGGKGAQLGELTRIEGTRVPPGYCVTTAAYRKVVAGVPALDEYLDRLSGLDPDDRGAITDISAAVRRLVAGSDVPDDVATEIVRPLARFGDAHGYAVRSSATAEDLPTASFAGQQDTYLDVVGPAAVLEHVRSCWASLFTERSVAYRLRHGVDHRTVAMAVVVQRMVSPDASGVLFTADPVTGNRRVVGIEATPGLGEALVSGRLTPDVWTVRDGHVVSTTIADREQGPALTEAQVLALARLGRRIEAHVGRPQDVEWCLAGGGFHIVQSRPITTLFPVPATEQGGNRVYLSVGHQQVMTDAMTPLGRSVWQMTTPRPMSEAGGRLFVDVTERLATSGGREALLAAFDPLTTDALRTVLDRDDFLPPPSTDHPPGPPPRAAPTEPDAGLVEQLVAETRASLAAAGSDLRTHEGPDLFDAILDDVRELRRLLFDPRSMQLIMAGLDATTWLDDRMAAWLGEVNAADVLSQSAPGNVTSEMGLALLDVADVIRPDPEVVAFLREVDDDGFLADLPRLAGGHEAQRAIQDYLDAYGVRCAGEIDIARPRWREQPSVLVPVVLGHVDGLEPGERQRRVEQGLAAARAKEEELVERLRALPDGDRKADQTRSTIRRLRAVVGFREFPKFGMISRYSLYRQALRDEAGRLVRAGVMRDPDDLWFLRFTELHDVVRSGHVDDDLVRRRREAFREYRALTPPRVLTSDGEALSGAYRRHGLPTGALPGLAVSTGIVEGRARVVLDMAEADLEPGDVLVTTFTDPSWSPAFVAIAGLVTEVGGRMTHGAVVAREYGLPAVVGVERATQRIRDGQRIRVDGTSGYVEILPAAGA